MLRPPLSTGAAIPDTGGPVAVLTKPSHVHSGRRRVPPVGGRFPFEHYCTIRFHIVALRRICAELRIVVAALHHVRLPHPLAPRANPCLMRAMQEIRGEGLSCFRGGRLVFDGLSFSVASGGALLLTGPNGSGKSSLLRLLAGLISPVAGTIYRDSEDVALDPASHRAATYYFAHAEAIKAALSVEEDLAFWAAMNGSPQIDLNAAITTLDLNGQRRLPGRYLSAGQRRRTALARLKTSDCDLWLLDEPSVGLDSASIEKLRALIVEHRLSGGAVIAATHVNLGLHDSDLLDITPFSVPPEMSAGFEGGLGGGLAGGLGSRLGSDG